MTTPDRMDLFERKCAELGQAAVARATGYSDSAISQARNGKYQGELDSLLAKIEEIYGSSTVECPVLGTITLAQCGTHRRRPFAATNPLRVRLFTACQRCPHKGGGK